MQVNTSVVKALMYLRGVGEPEMANITHTPLSDLQAWLYDQGENSEERVSFETQIEILKMLGIGDEAPRSDIIHYWRIHEPLFSRAESNYWALSIALKAFGKAQAVFISREADPLWNWNAKAHFGLRFEGFMAILEVTAHPLRSISFDPESMPDLSWVPDTFGVLMPDQEYDRLEPGAMKVRGMTQYLTYTTEMAQWERLREAALEQGIRAEQVAAMMLGSDGPVRIATASAASTAPAAAQVQVAATPATPAMAEKVADITELRAAEATRSGAEDMHLFITPVKSADRAPLKRVS